MKAVCIIRICACIGKRDKYTCVCLDTIAKTIAVRVGIIRICTRIYVAYVYASVRFDTVR